MKVKSLLIAGVFALGMIFALGGQPQARSTEDEGVQARMERGVENVDGYLQQGLSQKTHDAIAGQADSSTKWFKELKASVANVD